MNRKLIKVAVALILALAIFFGSGFAMNNAENVNKVQTAQNFFAWRSELKVESPFLYNVTAKELFQQNTTVPGFGHVDFLMNSMGGSLPLHMKNSAAFGVGVAEMELVFLNGNGSVFDSLGFSLHNAKLVGPNGTYVKMDTYVWAIHNGTEYNGLGVENTSNGTVFGFISSAANQSMTMADLQTGNYSLNLTMEFYSVVLGLPVPDSSVSFSIPAFVLV